MINLLKARLRHGYQAIPNPLTVPIHESFPGLPYIQPDADLEKLNRLCPVKAFCEKGLDLGKCVFCGICEREEPQMIDFKPNYQIATDAREKLIIAPEQEKLPPIVPINPRLIRRSFALRNVSAAGCNACELELGASTNVNFDMGRYGIEIEASPRHTDALILTGPISRNMADALQITWNAIPSPKYLVLCGSCAISGGIFAQSSELKREFLSRFEAQLFIAGCPAHPLSIIYAIHSFMGAK